MMYKKFLIFYLFVCNVDLISAIVYSCNRTAECGCSTNNADVNKIVGGEDSVASSWGWSASWQLGSHFCGGAIISPLHIITAAHCVLNATLLPRSRIVVGIDRLSQSSSSTAQVRSVNRVYAHPGYDKSTYVNDIAVLRLNEPLIISSQRTTARLCLPRVEPIDLVADYPANSAPLIAIGWGTLYSGAESIPSNLHLKQVTLRAVDAYHSTCVQLVRDRRLQFCAGVTGGGKDTCQGDSGGPLMRFESAQKRWVLAGVTSFGVGCGDPLYSGVYTRASVYLDWLRSTISDGFIESPADPTAAANKNYYNICIALLSVVQLCLISLWNK